MALATVRTDGWPQVTTVGFLAEDYDLVFVAARSSQKVANLTRDDRAAAALRLVPPVGPAIGLSIAGHVTEIADPADITRFNDALARRAPHAATFCPAGGSVAVVRLRAEIVTVALIENGRSVASSFRVARAQTLTLDATGAAFAPPGEDSPQIKAAAPAA